MSADIGSSSPAVVTSVDDSDLLCPDIPIQVQIYRQLRAEIHDGLWVGRDDFPGERELAERFKVSVITSGAALARLVGDGLISRGRGRRTQVLYTPPVGGVPNRLPQFVPEDEDSPYGFRLVRAGTGIVPADACHAFARPAGSHLWECVRLRVYEERAYIVVHHVQLPELADRYRLVDLQTKPIYSILISHGVELATVRRRVQATTPPPVVSRMLDVRPDMPVPMVVLTLHRPDGTIADWTRLYLRPDLPLKEEVRDIGSGYWATVPTPTP